MTRKISCTATGVQRGAIKEPQVEAQRRLKDWRCDLTGLSSSKSNLYFVAASDTIRIYQPSFPDQRLDDEPELILHPPISSPDLSFHVDESCPHSITRLVVEFLGDEEILLVVCDDGDVVGYSVSRIQAALERRRFGDDEETESEIRVFLLMNVGKSAWGLAVHREARMIAISANTHHITVVAFALAPPPKTNRESPLSGSYHEHIQEPDDSNGVMDRTWTNRVVKLRGHANIPSVSFDNNGSDPAGRWLYSADIKGNVLLWDLHNPQRPAQTIQVGRCASAANHHKAPILGTTTGSTHCSCADSYLLPHAAWSAFFVDPRAFRATSSMGEAFNKIPEDLTPGFWDITNPGQFAGRVHDGAKPVTYWEDSNSMEMTLDSDTEEGDDEYDGTPATNEAVNNHQMYTDVETIEGSVTTSLVPELLGQGVLQTWSQTGDTLIDTSTYGSSDGDEITTNPPNISGLQAPATHLDPEIAQSSPFQQAEQNAGGSGGIGQGPIEGSEEDTPSSESGLGFEDQDTPMDDADSETEYVPPADAENEVEDEEDLSMTSDEQEIFDVNAIPLGHVFANPPRSQVKKHYCEISLTENADVGHLPKSPTLIITRSEIFLLQSITPHDPVASASPVITITCPLFPHVQSSTLHHPVTPRHDRLCYSRYIPELGIFVAATPAGRIGIFSLTKCSATQRTIYGFRQDYLLPTAQQMDAHPWLRHPNPTRIVGVAVGPVQGQLNGEGQGVRTGQRWRMLVLYMDWSTVSYVLGDEDEMGVGNIVV